MADSPSSPLPPGTPLGDRLVVVRLLGEGGLGAVYEAEHKFTRHRRAVKVLHRRYWHDAEVVDRFLREASAAGRIGDPHIVETFDAGVLPDGAPFIVMEFLDGKPLSEVLRWNGRLDVGLAAELLRQACDALEAAHGAGVVHRDLKPDNLFVVERDGRAFLKVLDFGVSKFAGEGDALRSTRSGITMGTPLYMAPEQLKGAKHADARSDVYSLGVILYETLSGHVPFVADSFAELAVQVLHAPLPPVELAEGHLPDALDAALRRALERDPAQRLASAGALAAALAPFATPQSAAALLSDRAPGSPAAPERRLDSDTHVSQPAAHAAAGPQATPGAPTAPSSALAARAEAVVQPPPPRRGRTLAVLGLTAGLAVALLVGLVLHRRGGATSAPSSIAVLPFLNRTGDPTLDYLSEGLTESLIYELSRSAALRVVPRTSVYRVAAAHPEPLEAGRALGVELVVDGELGAHDVLRAELVDVRSQALLWGQRWTRPATEVLAAHRDVGRELLAALAQAGAAPRPHVDAAPPLDPEAFRLYLEGRFHWNKRTAEGLRRAAELFEAALAKDPGFALAWVGLGDSVALLEQYAGVPSKENCPKAEAAIEKALALAPSLAYPHASRALLLGHCAWRWPEAQAEFERALALDPNYATAHHWFALHLAYRGQFARAREEAREAARLDPLSLIATNAASVVEGYAGNWDAVLANSERLIAMDAAFPIASMWKGRALRAKGDAAGAVAAFERAYELSARKSFELAGELAVTHAQRGDAAQREVWRQRLVDGLAQNPSAALQLAMVDANAGAPADALRWLAQAFEARSWFLVQLAVEPNFAPLAKDERFVAYVRQVGLAPPAP